MHSAYIAQIYYIFSALACARIQGGALLALCWRAVGYHRERGCPTSLLMEVSRRQRTTLCVYTCTCIRTYYGSLIFLHLYRDCPGVGTSSGPAGKEVSYHGNVGGSSVGYKPPQHGSPQTRGPPPHFPQEPVVGPQANSPPLHINICGQVNAYARLFSLSLFLLSPGSLSKILLNRLVTIFRRTRCVAQY